MQFRFGHVAEPFFHGVFFLDSNCAFNIKFLGSLLTVYVLNPRVRTESVNREISERNLSMY